MSDQFSRFCLSNSYVKQATVNSIRQKNSKENGSTYQGNLTPERNGLIYLFLLYKNMVRLRYR